MQDNWSNYTTNDNTQMQCDDYLLCSNAKNPLDTYSRSFPVMACPHLFPKQDNLYSETETLYPETGYFVAVSGDFIVRNGEFVSGNRIA